MSREWGAFQRREGISEICVFVCSFPQEEQSSGSCWFSSSRCFLAERKAASLILCCWRVGRRPHSGLALIHRQRQPRNYRPFSVDLPTRGRVTVVAAAGLLSKRGANASAAAHPAARCVLPRVFIRTAKHKSSGKSSHTRHLQEAESPRKHQSASAHAELYQHDTD